MKNLFSQRNFLRKVSKWRAGTSLVAAFGLLGALGYSCIFNIKDKSNQEIAREKKSKYENHCEFGLEGSVPVKADELDSCLKAISDLGAEFIINQFTPLSQSLINNGWQNRWVGSEQGFKDFAIACRKYNLTFFANQEITNYSMEGDLLDENGNDILARPDKTHRWDITDNLLKSAAMNPEFRGVVYDEAEHGQLRRGNNCNNSGRSTGRTHPYFAATDGMTLEGAYDAVYKSAKNVAEGYRNMKVSPVLEAVFPSLLFPLARAGFDIAPKFMKESIDPVYAAIALGAAKQYGTEFYVNPDNWHFTYDENQQKIEDHAPGHSPEELRASLLYGYWIGATKIFVENFRFLLEKNSESGIVRYEPTEHGKIFKWFIKEYVPSHPRLYTFRDIRPKVAILRFDDSDWGQRDSRFTDNLYGAVNLKTTPETQAWFQIWNILTHRYTKLGALSFNSKKYAGLPHDFFYPLKDVIVYDHLAGEKELEGLKLVFLSGVVISPETMKAVRSFIKRGGFCISLASLAPSDLAGKLGVISEGSGKWLLVEDFLSEEVYKAVDPFLGKPDEISYNIGKQRLTVKCGKDRNTLRIYLQDENDIEKGSQLSDSSRVW